MTTRELVTDLTYLLASVLFILGLRSLTRPQTARRGMQLAALGMLSAICGTLLQRDSKFPAVSIRQPRRCAFLNRPISRAYSGRTSISIRTRTSPRSHRTRRTISCSGQNIRRLFSSEVTDMKSVNTTSPDAARKRLSSTFVFST